MNVVGIDCGAKYVKALIMNEDKVLAKGSALSGFDQKAAAEKALELALKEAGFSQENVAHITATGAGKEEATFAQSTITEVGANARALNVLFPSVRTVIDVGSEEGRAIKINEKGKVVDFAINEKCAAGAGTFTETMARALEIKLEEMGHLSFEVEEEPEPVSSTCVVFAKSEAVGLLRKGWPKEKVLAAYSAAMAHRVVELLERIKVEKEFAVTGSIAKNEGVVKRIEAELKMKALEPAYDTQIAGALGGALFAKALVEKERGLR
jgi:predicted CoA-substrate-specific enzyme activase